MPQPYIDFAYVKEHASFERVISGYNIQLLGSGAQRSVLCPFHRERKASCKIDLERNIFHCFGCEAAGNILEFVALLEGDREDLRTAALKIAELCEIALAPPRTVGARTKRSKPRTSRRARIAREWSDPEPARPRPVASPPQSPAPLANDNSAEGDAAPEMVAGNPPLKFALKLDPAHPYLAERGLSAETIAAFGLGYCARGSMAGRVCIPIHDEVGELVGYAGRWPGEDGFPEGEDRYKLPAKFQKSRVLYNLHRVAAGEHIVLVEGYWSVFRLHTLRIPVAGLMGWSIAPHQIALLCDRGVRFITLLLDGDDTGRRGRERVLPELASTFFVAAPILPEGEKPDSLDEPTLRKLTLHP